jgi:hypothetical protein
MDSLVAVTLEMPLNTVSGIRVAVEDLSIREGQIIACERRQAASSSAERLRQHRQRKRDAAGPEVKQ